MRSMNPDLPRLKALFDKNRARLLGEGHRGKWAVITDAGIVGVAADYQAAYLLAAKSYSEQPYALQEILPEDRVEHFTRVSWG